MRTESVPTPAPDLRTRAELAVAKSYGYDTWADVTAVADGEESSIRDAAAAVLAVMEPELARSEASAQALRADRGLRYDALLDALGLTEVEGVNEPTRFYAAIEAVHELRRERERRDRQVNEVSKALDEALTQVAQWKLLYEQRNDADILTQQRDEARAEADRLRAELESSRSGRGEVPDDAAVDRVALFLLRTKVYGTNVDTHYDTSATTQWQRVLTDAEREHWRDWARKLIAESGWGAVANPTDGEAEARKELGRIGFLLAERSLHDADEPGSCSNPVCARPAGPHGVCIDHSCYDAVAEVDLFCRLAAGHDGPWHDSGTHCWLVNGEGEIEPSPAGRVVPAPTEDTALPCGHTEAEVATSVRHELCDLAALDVPIRFWTCPIHREHVDEHGRKDATVEWRGGIAHCTTGDCTETSAPPAVSEEEQAEDAASDDSVGHEALLHRSEFRELPDHPGRWIATCRRGDWVGSGTFDEVENDADAHYADTLALSAPTDKEA